MDLSFKNSFVPLVIMGIIIAGIFYWFNQSDSESTPYSYVNGRIIQIATEVDGKVAKVYVQDNQEVKRGELLFELEQAPFNIAVEKATAQLNEAKRNLKERQSSVAVLEALVKQHEAELQTAKYAAQRTNALIEKGYRADQDKDTADTRIKTAQATLEATKAQLQSAKQAASQTLNSNEQVRSANAALNKAQLNANRSKVYSPSTGILTKFSVNVGEVVHAQQPLFKIVTTRNLWIDAQFTESQLARIRKGQVATVQLASYPNQVFHGVVESIAAATTNPTPTTGITDPRWVGVKIRITDENPKYPLRIGTSGKVSIQLNSQGKLPIQD